MEQVTLQHNIDSVNAAIALGMKVGAPVGSIVYCSYAEDQDEVGVVYVRGYHSTEDSARNELLVFAFNVWDNDEVGFAPWDDSAWESLDADAFATAMAAGRAAWIANHTDEEILDEFFGTDLWSVDKLAVEKLHVAPFTR